MTTDEILADSATLQERLRVEILKLEALSQQLTRNLDILKAISGMEGRPTDDSE